MNRFSWQKLSLVACLFGLSACSAVAQTIPPSTSQVPYDLRLILKTLAKGSQIYVCQAKADNSYEWTLKGPEAVLFDERGKELGKHYNGPTWESDDGSKVMGQVKIKADAPKADAIPWLVLEARSHEGNGVFSQVNWIARMNTVGGQPPAGGCDRDHENREVSVSYTSDYYFYGAN
jgi:hypothetical protein